MSQHQPNLPPPSLLQYTSKSQIAKLSTKSLDELLQASLLHPSWLDPHVNRRNKICHLHTIWSERSAFVATVRQQSMEILIDKAMTAFEDEFGRTIRTKKRNREAASTVSEKKAIIRDKIRACIESTVHLIPSGTGVRVKAPEHDGNFVLSCAHCLEGDIDEGKDVQTPQLVGRSVDLVGVTGDVFRARAIQVDTDLDLAILKVWDDKDIDPTGAFVCQTTTSSSSKILCIGNPYDWDLEPKGARPRKNGFWPFYASYGRLLRRSKIAGLGSQVHSCWTYWGHSGAPLFDFSSSSPCVVALHSSWNDDTGDRHGVTGQEICRFLTSCGFQDVTEKIDDCAIVVPVAKSSGREVID